MVALTAPALDTLERRVEAIQAELQVSIDRAGLRDDSLRHPLLALSSTIGLFPGLVAEMRQAVDDARKPLDPATVARIEQAAAAGASKRVGQLARARSWRTVAMVSAVFVTGALIAAAGGYVVGRSTAVATVLSVQAAAVRDGPDAAGMWAQLMTANDGALVARACKETGARSDGGRRACVLALWTEPSIDPAPRTMPAKQ